MINGHKLLKSLALTLAVLLAVSVVGPLSSKAAHASQSEIPLTISLPSTLENSVTPDLLAEFESAHSGVKVYTTFTDTGFFGFGGGSAVSDQLDSTESLVDAADVIYIDPSSITSFDTQAGYFLDLLPLVMSDADIDSSDFIPAVWSSYQWDNGMWALPLSTDVVLVTYDQTAFDEAGLSYPTERWTIDDFDYAARTLTQYNADGTVSTPGMSTSAGGNNTDLFLRSLLSAGLYDASTLPNAPSFTDPSLESILTTWYEMQQDGVVASGGGGFDNNIPLTIGGTFSFSQRFNPNDSQSTTTRGASLLPGSIAGLSVQAFAVSAGTQYPELAYDLAKFITSQSDLANNAFSVAPARYSLVQTTTDTTSNGTNGANGGDPNSGGAPSGGGPGGGGFGNNRQIPTEIQPVVDQGLQSGLPVSELRYTSYLSSALTEMSSNGGDAQNALQTVEAQAVSDMQTAVARNGDTQLYVAVPTPEPTLAPGEIALNCAVSLGFGGRNGDLPNQTDWDQVIADFVASDSQVGAVNLESVQGGGGIDELAQNYDCIILNSNAVPDADLSLLLNLDPLIDSDPTFDRNDVIGNTLSQLQQENKTWALPLAIEPQMLEYDATQFEQAGVPEPTDGWTIDAFNDALHTLKVYDTDPAPFVPDDPSGSYMLMLIAAYGGLPIDFRTDPVTINFTDPTTVDAIRQVLDLAADGYIEFSGLGAGGGGFVSAGQVSTSPAITTNSLNRFQFSGPGGPEGQSQATLLTTTYPQGQTYGTIAYNITTGYISATAQNPDATYRFLSTVALNPQLFSGMPVRQSLLSDSTVVASQGENVVQMYQQLDALIRDSNTIVFPTFTTGGGSSITSFATEYWLLQAFDHYVLEDADLDQELADAQQTTQAYMECAQGITVDATLSAQEQRRETADQTRACLTGVDPTFGQAN